MKRLVMIVATAGALVGTACKKKTEAGGGAAATGSASAAPTTAAGDTAAQKDLKATRGGQALGAVYAVARLDPNYGKTYAIVFAGEPITCATVDQLSEKAAEQAFEVRVREALAPDGSITWAYGQVAANLGATVPANLEKMTAFEVTTDRVSGTLPAGVAHESANGKLEVTGAFSASLCPALPLLPERDAKDRHKEAAPVPLTGGPVELVISGKRIEIKGATAMPGMEEGRYDVRLSSEPHGCSMGVRSDVVVTIGLGRETPTLALGGTWISGDMAADVEPSLEVKAKRTDAGVELTLAGTMDYNVDGRPGAQPYKVELKGSLTAPMCEADL